MYIMQSLFGVEQMHDIDQYLYLMDHTYNEDEFLDMIHAILTHEGGTFEFESIYFELPQKHLITKAVKIMLDPERYILYKTPSNLARILIQQETPEELEKGIPRNFNSFNFSKVI